MEKYKLIIVGAGASGLMAGITALKNGIKDILIIEKESFLGGNLNLFINNDFGGYCLGKKVPGPEFSSLLIKEYIKLGGKFKINSLVLDIDKNRIVKYINPEEGISKVEANSIILASGFREKYTGSIAIPVHKYTAIFTIAEAHRLINFQGHLPGNDVVICGDNVWSFILARRLIIEGANVKAIITRRDSLEKEIEEIINQFDLNILYNTKIEEIDGESRISLVKTIDEKNKLINEFQCDSLILSVSHYPNVDYSVDIYKEVVSGEVLKNNYKTSIEGVFCCGTLVDGIKSLLNSDKSGYEVGKIVSEALKESL